MRSTGPRPATLGGRIVAAMFGAALLASCSATADSDLQLAAPGYNATADAGYALDSAEPAVMAELAPAPSPASGAEGDAEDPDDASLTGTAAAGDATSDATAVDASAGAALAADAAAPDSLPLQVAYLPTAKPAAAETFPAAPVPSPSPSAGAAPQPATDDASAAPPLPETSPEPSMAAAEAPPQVEPKKKTFLASFFGAPSEATRQKAVPLIGRDGGAPVVAAVAAAPLVSRAKAEPLVELASAGSEEVSAARAAVSGGSALPGVRQTALFEIRHKSGIDDDSDVDLHEDEEAPVQLASAAGLARLAPNGLLKQTESVDVGCLKPSLLRMVAQVEQHYGRKAVITSGYRDPARNRRARGAKNSLHMHCAAVDMQIAGVSKWELASYVRAMPGRGGVGTYCHTESVHIDIGPERDWNWRCRRRR